MQSQTLVLTRTTTIIPVTGLLLLVMRMVIPKMQNRLVPMIEHIYVLRSVTGKKLHMDYEIIHRLHN